MFSLSRTNKKAGGVVIYTKKYLHATVLFELSSILHCIEKFFVNFYNRTRKFLNRSIYIPPSSSVKNFFVKLENLLQEVNANFTDHKAILAGGYEHKCVSGQLHYYRVVFE